MKNITTTLIFTLLISVLAVFQTAASSRFWIANSSSNWNNISNWSLTSGGVGGASVPNSTDTAFFDLNGLGDCTFDVNVNVFQLRFTENYVGTVSQNSFSLSVGKGGFVIQAADFLGGSATIDINGDISLNGGKFTSTSGELKIAGNYLNVGCIFVNNSGTVIFDGKDGAKTYNTYNPADEFNILKVDLADGQKLSVSSGDTLVVNSLLDCVEGGLDGAGIVLLKGDCNVTTNWDSGNAKLNFIGAGDSYLRFNNEVWDGSDIILNKSNLTSKLIVEDTDNDGFVKFGNTDKSFELVSGILEFEDGISADLNFKNIILGSDAKMKFPSKFLIFQGNYTNSGGTIDHNNGTVIFDGTADALFTSFTSQKLNEVVVQMPSTASLRITSGGSLDVANLICSTGKINGAGEINITDTCLINSSWSGGTAKMNFVGSGSSYLIYGNAVWEGNNIELEKDSNSDTLFIQDKDGDGLVTMGGSTSELKLVTGILSFEPTVNVDFQFQDIVVESGATIVEPSNKVQIKGNYINNGGNYNSNGGTVVFNGMGNQSFSSTNPVPEFSSIEVILQPTKVLSINSTDTLVVKSKLTCISGGLASGVVAVEDTCLVLNSWEGGDTRLVFSGSGNGYYLFDNSDWKGNDVAIFKNDKNANVIVQDLDGDGNITFGRESQNLIIERGILSFETGKRVSMDFGDLIISPNGKIILSDDQTLFSGNFNNNQGEIIHNNGIFTFNGTVARNFSSTSPMPVFYNLGIDMADGVNLSVISGDTLVMENWLKCTNGLLNSGTARINKICLVESGWDGGDTRLKFEGSGNSNFIFDNGTWAGNEVIVEKSNPTDSVLVMDMDGDGKVAFGATNKGLAVKNGVLSFESGVEADLNFQDLNITNGGTFVASDNKTFSSASFNNNNGTFAHNNGMFSFDGVGNRTFLSNKADSFYRVTIELEDNEILTVIPGNNLYTIDSLYLLDGKVESGSIHTNGNVVVGDDYDRGSATLCFIGSGEQNFFLNSTPSNYDGDVVLDKKENSYVNLLSPFTMDGSSQNIKFQKGWLATSTTNLLTIGDDITAIGGNINSYIEGPVRKIGNDAFSFPVGKNNDFAPIEIGAPTQLTDAFQAEYYHSNPNPMYDRSQLEVPLKKVSECEYWILDRTNGSSNVRVTLSWEEVRSCGVTEHLDLVVARWDGTEWKNEGNFSSSNNAGKGIVISEVVNDFSPFTLGSVNKNNPLPVSLIYFDANYNEANEVVELSWATASEINNAEFVLQKSTDGENWEEIGSVEGAGDSKARLDYYFEDFELISGVTYYRLKQIDFDGKFELSKVSSVQIDAIGINLSQVYPNPSLGKDLNISGVDLVKYSMFDNTGRLVEVNSTQSNGNVILRTQNLVSGIYFLRLQTKSGEMHSVKVFIN